MTFELCHLLGNPVVIMLKTLVATQVIQIKRKMQFGHKIIII